MPKNKEALIRYRIIDSCLRNTFKKYPSMDYLIAIMEEKLGKSFSVSTIQKDIKSMREDNALGYLAPIAYSKQNNGYYYSDQNYTIASIPLDESDIGAIYFATTVLDQFREINIFSQYNHAVDKIMEAVNLSRMMNGHEAENILQIEKVSFQKGQELLGIILKAIQSRKQITFDYTTFDRKNSKSHRVHPYLLKEYRHRWYLVGKHDRRQIILTYGLDRINHLIITPDDATPHPDFDPEAYFKYAIGITTYEGDPVKIKLSFTPIQGEYIKSQPIHHTQKILLDNDEEFQIEIEVFPSIELRMLLLGFGPSVKVLEPHWFAAELCHSMRETLERYAK